MGYTGVVLDYQKVVLVRTERKERAETDGNIDPTWVHNLRAVNNIGLPYSQVG